MLTHPGSTLVRAAELAAKGVSHQRRTTQRAGLHSGGTDLTQDGHATMRKRKRKLTIPTEHSITGCP